MLLSSTEALSGRSRFALKRYIPHFLAAICLSVVIVTSCACWLFSWGFPAMLAGDGLGLVGIYFLNDFWRNRPILIRCRGCDNVVSSITPWVCKACKAKNTDTASFPFVNQCKECDVIPKAFRCPHKKSSLKDGKQVEEPCGKMIFLTEDRDATNYAYVLNSPAEEPAPDPHAEAMRELRQAAEKADEERKKAEAQAELNSAIKRQAAANPEPQSAEAKLRAGVGSDRELEEAYAKLAQEYKETYKNDKAEYKRRMAALNKRMKEEKTRSL